MGLGFAKCGTGNVYKFERNPFNEITNLILFYWKYIEKVRFRSWIVIQKSFVQQMKIQWLATPILHRKYISTETSLFMIFCKTLA